MGRRGRLNGEIDESENTPIYWNTFHEKMYPLVDILFLLVEIYMECLEYLNNNVIQLIRIF